MYTRGSVDYMAVVWKNPKNHLDEMNKHKKNILTDGIRVPKEGKIMYLPDLANTSKAVAVYGKDGFYKVPIADGIVDTIQTRGGVLTHEDLASHTFEINYGNPFPTISHGITALIALGIIRALSLRIAFADPRYYVTNPQVNHFTVPSPEQFLSKKYLSERAKLANLHKRNDAIEKGYPEQEMHKAYFLLGLSQLYRAEKSPYYTLILSMVTRKTDSGDHELEMCFGVTGFAKRCIVICLVRSYKYRATFKFSEYIALRIRKILGMLLTTRNFHLFSRNKSAQITKFSADFYRYVYLHRASRRRYQSHCH
ncbi:nucleophile aminohydrolase [Circinella umbellata]|nr:nucleophile aminohydrolase [Circinella umbellata]